MLGKGGEILHPSVYLSVRRDYTRHADSLIDIPLSRKTSYGTSKTRSRHIETGVGPAVVVISPRRRPVQHQNPALQAFSSLNSAVQRPQGSTAHIPETGLTVPAHLILLVSRCLLPAPAAWTSSRYSIV
jgi:hypothetical protein